MAGGTRSPLSALDEHILSEREARDTGDAAAALTSSMVRAHVPQGQTVIVPDRHHVIANGEFTIDADAELVLAGPDAELVVLDYHNPEPTSVADRAHIHGFNSSTFSSSQYLLVSGVLMQATLGYVIQRKGSIVGASFSLNCTVATTPGTWLLKVMKNGIAIFSMSLSINSTGIKSAYLSQAAGLSVFAAGDVLSLRAEWGTFVGTVDDVFAFATLEYS